MRPPAGPLAGAGGRKPRGQKQGKRGGRLRASYWAVGSLPRPPGARCLEFISSPCSTRSCRNAGQVLLGFNSLSFLKASSAPAPCGHGAVARLQGCVRCSGCGGSCRESPSRPGPGRRSPLGSCWVAGRSPSAPGIAPSFFCTSQLCDARHSPAWLWRGAPQGWSCRGCGAAEAGRHLTPRSLPHLGLATNCAPF